MTGYKGGSLLLLCANKRQTPYPQLEVFLHRPILSVIFSGHKRHSSIPLLVLAKPPTHQPLRPWCLPGLSSFSVLQLPDSFSESPHDWRKRIIHQQISMFNWKYLASHITVPLPLSSALKKQPLYISTPRIYKEWDDHWWPPQERLGFPGLFARYGKPYR